MLQGQVNQPFCNKPDHSQHLSHYLAESGGQECVTQKPQFFFNPTSTPLPFPPSPNLTASCPYPVKPVFGGRIIVCSRPLCLIPLKQITAAPSTRSLALFQTPFSILYSSSPSLTCNVSHFTFTIPPVSLYSLHLSGKAF